MTALVKRQGKILDLRRDCAWDLAMGLLLLLFASAALGYPLRCVAQAVIAYGLIALGVLWLLDQHLPLRAFGAANRITLLRAVLVALLTGQIGQAEASDWLPAAVALTAVVLDGLDGWTARRRGTVSRFGARFDMEVDALLILVLAGLAWQLDKTGAWVLAAGALRYLFLAAQWAVPRLDRPLPPSRRRQAVCVLQCLALVACVSPLLSAGAAAAVAAGALGLLVLSFAIDLAWLARPLGERS
ncbi:MAG: CDP-alcohol phosphatidyltransferase family protein [Pseudomonadota bacterium]